MKKLTSRPRLLLSLVGLAVVAVGAWPVLRWMVERVSPMPANLGVQADGRLAPCPSSPNCVSTFATEKPHTMPAIPYTGTAEEAQQRLLTLLENLPDDMTLITVRTGYIHAEFRTPGMAFIDDVEFLLDERWEGIQFRSAARLGQGDMGVNYQRLKRITQLFAEG
jgi:uncharacterized protein (DUF1499 family)